MKRDRLYREIVKGLDAELDGKEFEACACALLKRIYRTLAPIPGGQDAGRDGAIAVGKGEGLPLVVTTSDVSRNVQKSLRSYKKAGGRRREVVVATSRSVTPPARRKVEEAARKLGFAVKNLHEQAWFATALYRDKDWRRDLLGIAGEMPALTTVPVTNRPLLAVDPIARDGAIAWLRNTRGDRLLVGEPGSGKTFLLHHLARDGWGLFLSTDDLRGCLPDSLRDEKPDVIIVDDAHERAAALSQLRQVREEIGAKFSIVATTWQGERAAVENALGGVGPDTTYELGPLTLDELVIVVHQAGIQGPPYLVQSIVVQADSRPGLATTMAWSCLRGATALVLRGKAMTEGILTQLGALLGDDVGPVIAAYALGGGEGMAMVDVASGLHADLLKAREQSMRVVDAGFLVNAPQKRFKVVPNMLRWATVRDVFLSGQGTDLPYQELLSKAPSRDAAIRVLVRAALLGGIADPAELRALVLETQRLDVWQDYALIGPDEAAWAVNQGPVELRAVGPEALRVIPSIAIPRLMSQAIGDARHIPTTLEHPLRPIYDFIEEPVPMNEAVRRRKEVARSVDLWLKQGGDPTVALRVAVMSLELRLHGAALEPGVGRRFVLTTEILDLESIRAIEPHWSTVKAALSSVGASGWPQVAGVLSEWGFPARHADLEPSHAAVAEMRGFAEAALRDVVDIFPESYGVLRAVAEFASNAGLDVEVPSDATFEVFYPCYRPGTDLNASGHRERVARLAEAWKADSEDVVADRLIAVWTQAREAGERESPWFDDVAYILGEARGPAAYVDALLRKQAAPRLVEPFIAWFAHRDPAGAVPALLRCINMDVYRRTAAQVTLDAANLDAKTIRRAVGALSELRGEDRTEALRRLYERATVRSMSMETVRCLLAGDDAEVRSTVALGEWRKDKRPREELRAEWRAAILDTDLDRHAWDMKELLGSDPGLLLEWMERRMETRDSWLFLVEPESRLLIRGLSRDQRSKLLAMVTRETADRHLVDAIVGNDLDMYRALLARDDLKRVHMAPLSGRPVGAWVGKARMALAHGYRAGEIAGEAFMGLHSIQGQESRYWKPWVEEFEALESDSDEGIRATGRAGKAEALGRMNQSLAEERREALQGLGAEP